MGNGWQKAPKIFFFGAGKIGKHWLIQFKDMGIVPDGILDNNKDLWGTVCGGVVVRGPAGIKGVDFDYIFITCRKETEVFRQLTGLGVAENKIVAGDFHILNHLFYQARDTFWAGGGIRAPKGDGSQKILFDLYNGMVLGGVESWSYDLAKRLAGAGYEGKYLATDAAGPSVPDQTYPVHVLRYRGAEREKEKIGMCVKEITENLPCTIICNFPQHIFWSACMVKHKYPDRIRIIAVVHNDDWPYYYGYGLWKGYIDKCMAISSRIQEKLFLSGIKQGQARRLEWKVFCKKTLDKGRKREDACLQIGYAGRVTMVQKRVDLFLALAKTLIKTGIDFRINIAGAGDYSGELRQKAEEEGLCTYIRLVGYIGRDEIPDFWGRQDIMASCSEYEGHSITQSEAMAAGAVPVITDVSGARDDVEDGYNGFIVAVGDIEAMANRICSLYHNRDMLKRMGERAHRAIYNRQKGLDQAGAWLGLLKEVWQQ